MEKTRFSLNITPEMRKLLNKLSEGKSMTATINSSIALLNAVREGEKNGERPAMIKDGKVVARLVSF